MNAHSTQMQKDFLATLSIQTIINNIKHFRSLNIRSLDDEQLATEIAKVISSPEGNSILPVTFHEYPAGTEFFRVRKLPADDHVLPFKNMSSSNDAWNPPTQYITRRGRLNKEHESLLYVSPINPDLAVKEMRVSSGEIISLIIYTSQKVIKVNTIGFHQDDPELTADENLKMQLLNDFLKDEFTRDVGTGTEFLYRISEQIAKTYYDMPPRAVQDAWAYHSVVDKASVNVCLRPEIAKELLQIKCVLISKTLIEKDRIGYDTQVATDTVIESSPFTWHRNTSEKFKEIFTNIAIFKKP